MLKIIIIIIKSVFISEKISSVKQGKAMSLNKESCGTTGPFPRVPLAGCSRGPPIPWLGEVCKRSFPHCRSATVPQQMF